MEANIFRLIVRPLIGRAILHQKFFGVRPVAHQGNNGHAHGEDGHRDGNGGQRRVFASVFRVLLQLAQFIRHEFILLLEIEFKLLAIPVVS